MICLLLPPHLSLCSPLASSHSAHLFWSSSEEFIEAVFHFGISCVLTLSRLLFFVLEGTHTHTHKQLKEETKLCLSLYLSLSVAVRGRYSRSPKLLHHHEELCAAAAVGGLDDPGVLSARLHRWVTALGSIKGGGDTPPSPDGRGAERRVCCSFNGHLWELPGVVSFSFWRDSKQVNKHLKHSVQLQTHGQHSAQSVSLPNAFDSQAFCELAGLIKRTTSVRADGWWSSRSARLQSHRLSDWLADTGEPLERCTLAVIWIRLSLRYFM